MKFFEKETPTETAASRKIAKSLETLEGQIQSDVESRDEASRWSSRLGTVAIALGVLVVIAKAPIIMAGFAVSALGWGVARMIRQGYEDSIAKKLETKAKLTLAEEAARIIGKPEPAAANKPGIRDAYNAKSEPDADRITALEERIRALQDEIGGKKPVVLDKPKTIISRLGF